MICALGFTKLNAQLPSPDLRCLSVAANGDVTLTWLIPPDPSNIFIQYNIWYSTNCCAGFQLLLPTISTYGQTTFIHTGAGANIGPRYYYMETVSNFNGNVVSIPVDTLSTIFLTLSNPGNGQTGNLAWNVVSTPLAPTSAGVYDVYNDNPNPWSYRMTTPNITTTDVVKVCNQFVNYYVQVGDAQGCASVSNTVGATFQDNTPPSTPVLDSVSVNPATNNATLGWEQGVESDIEGYIIYQYIGGFWVPIDTVYGQTNTYYENANSVADTKSEMYCIAAIDSCGKTSPLGNFQQTIYAIGQLDPCIRKVDLSWTNYVNWTSGVAGYNVWVSFNAGSLTLVGTTTPSQTTFTHTGIVNGTYCYIIQAFDGQGLTSSSNRFCITAAVSVAPVYTYIRSASVLSTTSIEIKAHVDPLADVTAYRFERADSPTGPFSPVATVPFNTTNSVSYIDGDVFPLRQSYYYRVVTIDICGQDAQTSATAKTIYLSGIANTDRTNTITWTNYEGFDGGVGSYDIYRAIDGGGFIPVGNVTFGNNTFTDDVDPYYTSNGRFSYYVVANEAIVNVYGFQETSNSNPGDVFQYSKFFVPNAFVPGGVNTIFMPQGAYWDKTYYRLTIFNRWGEKVFETEDYSVGWDGTYGGEVCQQGVFAYYIEYTESNGKVVELAGTVTLIGK